MLDEICFDYQTELPLFFFIWYAVVHVHAVVLKAMLTFTYLPMTGPTAPLHVYTYTYSYGFLQVEEEPFVGVCLYLC